MKGSDSFTTPKHDTCQGYKMMYEVDPTKVLLPNSQRFLPEELKEIERKLNLLPGPEMLCTSTDSSGNQKFQLEHSRYNELANFVFGPTNWTHTIIGLFMLCEEECEKGLHDVDVVAVVRITLKDGSWKEGIGHGKSENSKSKASAHAIAFKKAVSDARQRAFNLFGNLFGGCLSTEGFSERLKNAPDIPLTSSGDEFYADYLSKHPRNEDSSDKSMFEEDFFSPSQRRIDPRTQIPFVVRSQDSDDMNSSGTK